MIWFGSAEALDAAKNCARLLRRRRCSDRRFFRPKRGYPCCAGIVVVDRIDALIGDPLVLIVPGIFELSGKSPLSLLNSCPSSRTSLLFRRFADELAHLGARSATPNSASSTIMSLRNPRAVSVETKSSTAGLSRSRAHSHQREALWCARRLSDLTRQSMWRRRTRNYL